jgi:hypothetical protein
VKTFALALIAICSPDGAKRNPGSLPQATPVPDCASLHPGYERR